ncbi:MAG: hypothetical protein GXP58_10920 [Deltaproteobacteria bacterium]|nr:hypothetical protein [Deltaproteobacteria bacterium]
MQHQERGIICFSVLSLLLLLSGLFFTAPATAGLQSELTARLNTAYPHFTGKIIGGSGKTLVVKQTSAGPVQPGATLLVRGKTEVRVLSVRGTSLKTEMEQPEKIRPGETVTGLPRPLKTALVPLSKNALQYLLLHPFPKGEIETVRTEDVLTAMIEMGITDFSTIQPEELSGLRKILNVDLILQVKTMEGLGEKLLRIAPVPEPGGSSFPPFSVLLNQGTFPAAIKAATSASLVPQQVAPPMPVMLPAKPGSPAAFVPLVPEQQEPKPAPALQPSATPSTTPSAHRMPELSGFNSPDRWVRILELSDEVVSMATGSLTGLGKKELALSFPGEIRIYSYSERKNRFRERKTLESEDLDTLFRIETYDVNGDGEDEVIGDTDRGVVLITVQGENPKIVEKQKGIVIRKIGDNLFSQKIADLTEGNPVIHPVSWNGRRWVEGGDIKIPDGADLFSLVSLSSAPPRFIDSDHRLTGAGKSARHSGYGRCNIARLLKIDFPVTGRSLTVPFGELLFSNTTGSTFKIGKVNYPTGGKVIFLSKEAAPISSPPFLGYVADIALYDMDGDGTDEIFVSEISSGLTGTKTYILRY